MERKLKAVSTAIAAVLLVVGLVIGAAVVYVAVPSSTSTSTSTVTVGGTQTVTTTALQTATASGLSGTISLGLLVPLTGPISAYGIQGQAAGSLAVKDINSWLTSSGLGRLQFAIKAEDTQADPTIALQDVQTLSSAGVQEFVGPMTSSETHAILAYANENHLVLFELGTSASLLQPLNSTSHYWFMMQPSDNGENAALAQAVSQAGYKAAIVIYRDDSWGVPFHNSFYQDYSAKGGHVLDNISYTPLTTGTYDFTPQLSKASSDMSSGVSQYGAGHVAVVCMCFDEETQILSQVTSYSNLLTNTWFTVDSVIQDQSITSSAGSTAQQLKLVSTIWAPVNSSKTNNFMTEWATTGVAGSPYSTTLAFYDAVWIAALSIMTAGTTNGASVQPVVTGVASNYYGVSGWAIMDQYGEITPGARDYTVWAVVPVNNAPTWAVVGDYHASTGTITYNTGFSP